MSRRHSSDSPVLREGPQPYVAILTEKLGIIYQAEGAPVAPSAEACEACRLHYYEHLQV